MNYLIKTHSKLLYNAENYIITLNGNLLNEESEYGQAIEILYVLIKDNDNSEEILKM